MTGFPRLLTARTVEGSCSICSTILSNRFRVSVRESVFICDLRRGTAFIIVQINVRMSRGWAYPAN